MRSTAPTLLVNQRLPSTAWAMAPPGPPGVVNSTSDASIFVSSPAPGSMRPTLPLPTVNQILRSGPTVMPKVPAPGLGTLNSVIVPLGVIRPTLSPVYSVNQRLPSGPTVIAPGPVFLVGTWNV